MISVPSPASSHPSSLPTRSSPHISPRRRAEAEPDAVPSSASGPLSATPIVPQTFHTPLKRSLIAFRASIEPSIQLRHPAQVHGWSSMSPPESGVRPIKIEFIDILTANHNRQLPAHSQMRRTLRPYEYSGNYYGKWCFVKESTIGTVHEPWGIELVSPIFWACPDSAWRKDVEATWQYLERQYSITKSASCATHIHISFQPPGIFTLEDIRRIALAILHFETAFEVLIPPDRRRNLYAKSNWLVGQHLGLKNKSRPESMAAINDATDMIQLIHLMQPVYDRDYAWNFNNLFDSKRTIEFRKPPGSTTADQALAWAELALSFVQAAVRYGTLEKLQRVPSTVRGLYWFMEQATVPSMNEPGRLERLFDGTAPDAALEPQGIRSDLSYREERQWEEASKRKTAADERRVIMHAQTVQDPYW
ncbi:hypothetical protein GJ744_003106 [Endocarpon pusillum]|uniref:Amidoligase enzyme n=1 Tax=Endocarpon pusillum TaxID=364733 RepID=A0A8H7E887_9EURO|nr:hypothetical protein GJ744_003106 [Endocarpon pusillum]